MLDLTHTQLGVVQGILRQRFPGRQARVFGSRATVHAKPWSDLDVVILGDEPVDDLALFQARADFEESDLPFRVDLALWRDLPGAMQQRVAGQGEPL